MEKKSTMIFYITLFVILIGLSIFIIVKIKKDDGIKEKKNAEEEQSSLFATVFTIENTYYGTEYTFKLLNSAEEEYIKVQYHEDETYTAKIGRTLIGSTVEIKYTGVISEYMDEWDVGGHCFVLNLHDIISILPDK